MLPLPQDTGNLVSFDNIGTYTMYNGLDAGLQTGPFIAFAEWWSGPGPIEWTMTATTGDGEVLFTQDGVFTEDCSSSSGSPTTTSHSSLESIGTTRLFYFNIGEYIDNGCENTDGGGPNISSVRSGDGRR